MNKAGKYFIYGFILLLSVIFIDQYTKWLIIETVLRVDGDFLPFTQWFITHDPLEFFFDEREVFNFKTINPFVNLLMVWNQGISFGMFDTNIPEISYVFASISMLISIFMIIWLALTRHFITSIAIALIAGGAIGNALDRLRFRAVADFIDVHYNEHHWPAFNVADICITIGAFILAYILLFVNDDINETVDV